MVNWSLRSEDQKKVKSLNLKSIILGLSVTFCVSMLVWFVGWAVAVQFNLWYVIKTDEYRITLFVLMGLTILMGAGITLKESKNLLKRPKAHLKKAEDLDHKSVDIGPMIQKLDEISGKVADIHSMMKFMKSLKEKTGDKN